MQLEAIGSSADLIADCVEKAGAPDFDHNRLLSRLNPLRDFTGGGEIARVLRFRSASRVRDFREHLGLWDFWIAEE